MILVARYIAEDNQTDYVEYNEDTTVEASIVKSVFRKLLNNYKLLTEDEEEHMINNISKIIVLHKGVLD